MPIHTKDRYSVGSTPYAYAVRQNEKLRKEMTVKQLAERLYVTLEPQMERGNLRGDIVVTEFDAMELAERIDNASSEKEAQRIEGEIHKYCDLEADGHSVSSLIWDYGVNWNKVAWAESEKVKHTGHTKFDPHPATTKKEDRIKPVKLPRKKRAYV